MKTNSIVAVCSLAFASFVAAAPVDNIVRRDIVYTTTTEEVYETFWTTTTVWVDSSVAAATDAASSSFAGFYEEQSSASSSVVAPVITASDVPVAAPSSKAYVAPTPTPTPAAAPAAAPVASPQVAAESPAANTVAASAGSSSTTTGSHVGDLTNYSVEVGLSSCGFTGLDSEPLVALPAVDMQNAVNPNLNPKCGKYINIYYNGAVHKGKVHDTCPECKSGALDVTLSLFNAIAPNGDGRVSGVSWDWA